MARRSAVQGKRLDEIENEFLPLLVSCLQDCAQGRWGLFGQNNPLPDARRLDWPEANRLRELAHEIKSLRREAGGRNELCDRFLCLCSLRCPDVPEEPKLAAAFLDDLAGMGQAMAHGA